MAHICRRRGFTLIEILLVLAGIGIIAGMSAPVYQSFQVRNDLDVATVTLAQSYRRAQMLARATDGNSTWGVSISSGHIVVFKGVTYASRDTAYDEESTIPTSITPTGVSEVVFAKLTGTPGITGTTTLTSNNNETRSININAKGTVNY